MQFSEVFERTGPKEATNNGERGTPRSSSDNLIEQPPTLGETMRQLADAQSRAMRAELHYAFEVERRKSLEDRIARLEGIHNLAPVTKTGKDEREAELRPSTLDQQTQSPDPRPVPDQLESPGQPQVPEAPRIAKTSIPMPVRESVPLNGPAQRPPSDPPPEVQTWIPIPTADEANEPLVDQVPRNPQ